MRPPKAREFRRGWQEATAAERLGIVGSYTAVAIGSAALFGAEKYVYDVNSLLGLLTTVWGYSKIMGGVGALKSITDGVVERRAYEPNSY